VLKRAFFLLLLLSSPPAAAQIPADFFGMHAFFATRNLPTVSIGTLGKTTCTSWSYAEPTRGTYNWYNFDFGVAKATALGVDYFVTFYGIPAWAVTDLSKCVAGCGNDILNCDGTVPSNLTDVDHFGTALATRYCGTPLKYIELGNEPYTTWSATDFAAITIHLYNAIRTACPSMNIITPSMHALYASWASDYFAAGGPTAVDIASIHAGLDDQGVQTNIPEGLLIQSLGQNNYWGPIKSVIDTYLPGKPIWSTESSWGLNTDTGVQTTDERAGIVSRFYIMHWSAGLSRLYWYGWDEANIGTLAPSLDPPGSSIPAIAYQETYNWLVGRTMAPRCAAASDGVTWACGLTGPRGYVGLIVWDTAGDESYKPPASGGYTRYRDLAGKVTPYSGDPVAVGVKPILFEH
jgi:hypothetical protein